MMRGWRRSGGGLWGEFAWMEGIDGMGVLVVWFVAVVGWWGYREGRPYVCGCY